MVNISMLAMVVNFLATWLYGQEPAAHLREDAQAAFGVVTAPSQEELQKPIVQQGRHLFWNERLSANGKGAYASCHAANTWGADSERYSQDAKGKLTKRKRLDPTFMMVPSRHSAKQFT